MPTESEIVAALDKVLQEAGEINADLNDNIDRAMLVKAIIEAVAAVD